MFVDQVKIFVKGGDGGNGCVSFRREAHVPRGGPDGGVGGKGGDVVLVAVSHQNTLLPLRYHAEYRAERGGHGGPGNRTGADGDDLSSPCRPAPRPATRRPASSLGEVLRDGRPPRRRARRPRGPRKPLLPLEPQPRPARGASRARPGEERWLRLDLRLIADVGLLGLPNAGKSTLLSRISAARPKVADYPFTTLTPVLGVVEVDERTFVAADIPGIIEGAHRGAGLGLHFLRHVERTRVLLHVVDASGTSGRDPVAGPRPRPRGGAPLATRPRSSARSSWPPRKRDAVGEATPCPRSRRRRAPRPRGAAGLGGHRRGARRAQAPLLGVVAASRAAMPLEERA